jgi:hypothetical protein
VVHEREHAHCGWRPKRIEEVEAEEEEEEMCGAVVVEGAVCEWQRRKK